MLFKKLLMVMMALLLVGCSSSESGTMLDDVIEDVNQSDTTDDDNPFEVSSSDDTGDDDTSEDDGQDSDDAGSDDATVITPVDGLAYGGIGDIMRTVFFDFSINSAYVSDTFDTIQASDGNTLLIAEATIENTMSSTITMVDTDFLLSWDLDKVEDEDYPVEWPLSEFVGEEGNEGDYSQYEAYSDQQLPAYYDLESGQSITGYLVYEIPTDCEEYLIMYEEYYADGSYGDAFGVAFTAE